MSPALSEFQLIKQYFEGVGECSPKLIELGIGDDCAVTNIPQGKSLCFSLDTMVEGLHFPVDAPADKVAQRAMAAAISDLAAMGAEPAFFTLSLTIPEANLAWLEGFSQGLRFMADTYGLALLGGDTTRGPLAIAIQVHGLIDSDTALCRSGANIGDVLVVTGTLGDAGAALDLLDVTALRPEQDYLLSRYYMPTPRVAQGLQIRDKATACIDISDGLVADARHIANASQVGLMIDVERLPLSSELKLLTGEQAKSYALSSGDDYELLFTLPKAQWEQLRSIDNDGVFTCIGSVVSAEPGVHLSAKDPIDKPVSEGYQHFG